MLLTLAIDNIGMSYYYTVCSIWKLNIIGIMFKHETPFISLIQTITLIINFKRAL